jgi:SHS2 domain-containing protein
MPYEEIAHTADWCLRVWAADMAHLFIESAKSMNALSGIALAEGPRLKRTLSASALDAESLLIAFLSELVNYYELDRLAFDHIDLTLDLNEDQPCSLTATLFGAGFRSRNKLIKAVTYHDLNIRQTGRGYEVEIVFDV